MTTWKRKFQAQMRAEFAIWAGNKFPHECKACHQLFFAYRPDAQTCSSRCRKAFSRSPAGHIAKLKRMGQAFDQANSDQRIRKWRRMTRQFKASIGLMPEKVIDLEPSHQPDCPLITQEMP